MKIMQRFTAPHLLIKNIIITNTLRIIYRYQFAVSAYTNNVIPSKGHIMYQYNDQYNCTCKSKQKCNTSMIDNSNIPIAMAYVPFQKFENLYSLKDGCMGHGTIFKDLEKPFIGRRI